MFEIYGSFYVLNLEKINNYLFTNQIDKNVETHIEEFYDSKNNVDNKKITEHKFNNNENSYAIKYDLFKELMGIIYEIENDGTSDENLVLSQKLVLNTFINEGFLELATNN